MLTLCFQCAGGAARRCILLVALALIGCGAKDEPPYRDVGSYCNGRAEAECSKEVLLACAIPNLKTCASNRAAACRATTPTGMTFNPRGAEQCIKAVEASFLDAKLSAQENLTVVEACSALFDGPGAANAECKTDGDCRASANLRCVLRGGSDVGTCQVPVRVSGGGVCSQPNQLCAAGYHCGATEHCDINGQVGEPCNDVLPCVESARCVAGKCERKLEDGSPCATDGECISALCARGMGSVQGLCVSQMTLAPNEPFCVDSR